MKRKPNLYESNIDCCGCSACFAVCPHGAISMTEDSEGFEYPQINESKCICCYRCIAVCPMKNCKTK